VDRQPDVLVDGEQVRSTGVQTLDALLALGAASLRRRVLL
jgi:hypothetical protein